MTNKIHLPNGTHVLFDTEPFLGNTQFFFASRYLKMSTREFSTPEECLAETCGSHPFLGDEIMVWRFYYNGEFAGIGANMPRERIETAFLEHSSLSRAVQRHGSLRYFGDDFFVPDVATYAYEPSDGVLYMFWEDEQHRFDTAIRIGEHVALLLVEGKKAIGWAVEELDLLLPSSASIGENSDRLLARNIISKLFDRQQGEGFEAIDDREPKALAQLEEIERTILQRWDELPAANTLFDAASEIRIAAGLPARFEKPAHRAP